MILEESMRMSDIPEGYKQTKVGVIPVEWDEGPVSSIAFVNPRTNTSHLKEDSPVSFLPMENVGEDGTVHVIGIRPYVEVQNGYTIFTDGDILFAKITPCMENGKGALVRDLINGVGFGSTEFHVLRPADPEDAEFIYQLSRASSFRTKATRYFTGSAGQQRVSKDVFTHYLCPIPTPEERHRIATVLSTVDAAIAATDEVIAKTEDLKRGLMQDLLTKGIDEEGRVRSEETHEFCEKKGMWVPVEWEVLNIGDISSFVGSGITPRGGRNNYKKYGIPFLRSQNIHFDGLRLKDVAFIDEITHKSMKRTQIQDLDILLNITGASIGRCTVVPIGFGEGNVNQHVCIIRTLKNTDSKFIALVLSSHLGQSQIGLLQVGLSREGLNYEQVKSIRSPLPPLPEQHHIATILSTVERDLAAERARRARLQTLKKGLMQDLLTGQKRVPLNGGDPHGV